MIYIFMHAIENNKNYKILLILRHAKSSWKNKKLNDHDRPLNKRGRREAVKMGKYLKKINMIPNTVVTSSALRAIQTTALVCRHSEYKGLVKVNSGFHLGGMDSYLHSIAETASNTTRLLIIGHNPGLEELVRFLTCRSLKIHTCTLVQLNLEIVNWKNIAFQQVVRSEIMNIWRPKKSNN